jgi:ubiquinone biosynthesis protein
MESDARRGKVPCDFLYLLGLGKELFSKFIELSHFNRETVCHRRTPMKPLSGGSSHIPFRRASVIVSLLVKHGLADLAERIFRKRDKERETLDEAFFAKQKFPNPRRIRLVLEELGPTFVKLGQMMSTRADVFPPEYIHEFKKLQDQIPPVAFSRIKALVELQLKSTLSEVFSEFAAAPFAAASVAQVHFAMLRDNVKVAVKVIRPGIRKKIREDIRLMYYLAERVEKSFEAGRIIGPVELVREFERTIYKELDMHIEAGSIEKFRENFKNSEDIYIPKVYWGYVTKSVLVMEHIEGIKMDQVEEIKRHGIDPKKIALIGLHGFSRQLMEFGFFHADPHPGNTIVMYDGRVALVDFGITGYLDRTTMNHIAGIFLGYADHDYDRVMDALSNAGLINEQTIELGNFRADLEEVSETFYGRTLSAISMKDVYDQIMQLVLKYRIRLPRNLLLLMKTLVQNESLGKILNSDASILEVTKPYAKALIARETTLEKTLSRLSGDAKDAGSHLKMFPKLVHDILWQVATGGHRLEVLHRGFHDLDAQLEKAVNRLTVGLIVCASIIGGSIALNSSQKVLEFSIPSLSEEPISLTAFLGVFGYGIATVLGLWLVISILLSRKV